MKAYLNKISLPQIWLYLLILSIFFPVMYVLLTPSAYLLGTYSDFTSFSIYGSDILILVGSTTALIYYRKRFVGILKDKLIVLLGFWLLTTTILHYSTNTSLNYYVLGRYAELMVLYGTIQAFAEYIKLNKTIYFFTILAFLQVVVELYQFSFQTNLGISHVGESIIAPHVEGVAKILAEGLIFIRGYGTFPHANVLSAVLGAATMFSLYKYFSNDDNRGKFLWLLSCCVLLTGTTLTFSRAGILASFVGSATFILGLLWIHVPYRKIILKFLPIVAVLLVNITILNHLLVTRASVFDTASNERRVYNNIGINMVTQNPIFGIGLGTSLLHMQQFSHTQLQPWEHQPIHNYYLLAAAEIGIVGSFILILFFLRPLIYLIREIKKARLKSSLELENTLFNMELLRITFLSIIVSFLVLMLFDHYFYTIHQTQLLLWTILGLASTITERKPIMQSNI